MLARHSLSPAANLDTIPAPTTPSQLAAAMLKGSSRSSIRARGREHPMRGLRLTTPGPIFTPPIRSSRVTATAGASGFAANLIVPTIQTIDSASALPGAVVSMTLTTAPHSWSRSFWPAGTCGGIRLALRWHTFGRCGNPNGLSTPPHPDAARNRLLLAITHEAGAIKETCGVTMPAG